MKKLLKSLLIVIMVMGTFPAWAQADIFDNISSEIRSGDAKQISKYFGNNVDLTILNTEEVYSKAQAEQVLKDFFTKNTPKSFTIIHQGLSKESSKYAIGNYVAGNGTVYRTYIYIKTVAGADQIQELSGVIGSWDQGQSPCMLEHPFDQPDPEHVMMLQIGGREAGPVQPA